MMHELIVLVPNRCDVQEEPESMAGLMGAEQLDREGLSRGHAIAQALNSARVVRRAQQDRTGMFANDLRKGKAGDVAESFIDPLDVAIEIGDEDGIFDFLGNKGKSAQIKFGAASLEKEPALNEAQQQEAASQAKQNIIEQGHKVPGKTFPSALKRAFFTAAAVSKSWPGLTSMFCRTPREFSGVLSRIGSDDSRVRA